MSALLLQHLLTQSSDQFPSKTAVVHGNDCMSYASLEKHSNQLAHALLQLGVRESDRIGIQLTHSIDAVVALFGILKAGAVYVPIDPISPIERSRQIIGNCTLKVLITSADLAKKNVAALTDQSSLSDFILTGNLSDFSQYDSNAINVHSWAWVLEQETSDIKRIQVSGEHPAYILHTSGSTGIPKGVAVSHHGSLSFVNMVVDRFEIDSSDNIASHAPLHFDLSVFDIFTAMHCGATVVMVPRQYSVFPKSLAKYIAQQKISIWNSVSSVISLLAVSGKLAEVDLSSMRVVHFSGEILPTRYLKAAMAAMPTADFYNIYGQTEANSTMCYPIDRIPDEPNWKMPIGNAMPGCHVFALDEDDREIVATDREGELFVRSDTIALGYWNDESSSNEKFIDDPRDGVDPGRVYQTGDIVKLNEKGEFVLVGRKDNLIKSRGYRIDLGEVESVLYRSSAVKAAAVVAIPHELIGNEIIAYVSLNDEAASHELLYAHCSRYLAPYMLPKTIEILDELPYTSTRKVDRKRLVHDAVQRPAE